jgi:antitoxin HicB
MRDVGKYSSHIFYSDEDQGFIATVPELPGCSAFGVTSEEALAELKPAIEAWISAAQEAGNPVPTPAALNTELPSGKFLVRVARTVHAQLTNAAHREGVSLNHYVSTLLATATLGDVYAQATTRVDAVGTSFSFGGQVQFLDSGALFNQGYVYQGLLPDVVTARTTSSADILDGIVMRTQSAAIRAARLMATNPEAMEAPSMNSKAAKRGQRVSHG